MSGVLYSSETKRIIECVKANGQQPLLPPQPRVTQGGRNHVPRETVRQHMIQYLKVCDEMKFEFMSFVQHLTVA